MTKDSKRKRGEDIAIHSIDKDAHGSSKDRSHIRSKRSKSDSNGTIPIFRGRFKERFLRKHSSLLHNTEYIKGILISSNVGNETRALGQARMFLEKQLDALFPNASTLWQDDGPKALDIDLDIVGLNENKTEMRPAGKRETSEEDEQEKGSITATETTRRDRRFQAVDAACGGLLFLRFRVNVTPTEFMNSVFENAPKMEATVWNAISHCHRFLPLEKICASDMDDVIKTFQELITNFPFPHDINPSISLNVEIRNRDIITKKAVIEALAPCIPSRFKIDLTRSQYTVIVSIFKSICGMSIVTHYTDRKKLNLLQYVKSL